LTAIIIACYNWYNQDCTRVHPSTRHCTRRDNQTIREFGTVATLRHSLGQQPTTADCQVPSTDNKREAQISRRGHWMFRVTEYFAKSLKVIGNSIVQKLEYRFLFAFHSNYRYGGIFGCFDTIHECDRQTPSQLASQSPHDARQSKRLPVDYCCRYSRTAAANKLLQHGNIILKTSYDDITKIYYIAYGYPMCPGR